MKSDEDYDPDSIFRDFDEDPIVFDNEETSEEEVLEDDPNDFMHSTDDEDNVF